MVAGFHLAQVHTASPVALVAREFEVALRLADILLAAAAYQEPDTYPVACDGVPLLALDMIGFDFVGGVRRQCTAAEAVFDDCGSARPAATCNREREQERDNQRVFEAPSQHAAKSRSTCALGQGMSRFLTPCFAVLRRLR